MRDYGKVHSSFWTSQTIRTMTEDARSLSFYLLTCPHGTISGVFRLPDGYVCDDLQWDSERVNKGLNELLAKGFANRCETTKWIWINKYFEWNKPENPNQIKSAAKIAASIPDECGWKREFMRLNADFLGIEKEPLNNPSETLSEPVTVTGTVTGTVTVIKTCSRTSALEDCFEQFWNSYPKKVGKDKALIAWKKKKPPIESVMKALAWQVKSQQWLKDNKSYIPNPTTYINEGRWKDELPPDDFVDFVQRSNHG